MKNLNIKIKAAYYFTFVIAVGGLLSACGSGSSSNSVTEQQPVNFNQTVTEISTTNVTDEVEETEPMEVNTVTWIVDNESDPVEEPFLQM